MALIVEVRVARRVAVIFGLGALQESVQDFTVLFREELLFGLALLLELRHGPGQAREMFSRNH